MNASPRKRLLRRIGIGALTLLIAVIPETETEIVAVSIAGTSCEFFKIPLIDQVFRPDCASGLTVVAKLEQHP